MSAKKTTRKAAKPTPTVSATDVRSSQFWVGVGAIVLGVVLLAYLAYGVALYFTDLTDDFTRFWTSLFYYPAAHVYTGGYFGWLLLGLIPPLLVLGGFVKIVYYGRKGALTRQKLMLAGGALGSAVLLSFFVPSVSDSTVGYGGYLDRYEALKTFQSKQAQLQPGSQVPGEPELRATALQQLVLADILRQEATKYGVSVPDKEINEFYNNQAEQNQGEENLEKQLKDFLGWTPKQFKQEVRLRLLQEKLNEKLATDEDLNKDRKEKAEEYLKRVKAGEDFATVAKEAGGALAEAGGDQGTIKRGEADPKIETAVFDLQPGQVSDVITTERGFVIVKVEAKPSADEATVRQITVATQSLNEFIPEELKKAKVSVYVHDLVWDKGLYTVRPKEGSESEQPVIEATETPAAAPAPAQ